MLFKIKRFIEKVERLGYVDYYISVHFDELKNTSVCVITKNNKIVEMDLLEDGILSYDWALDTEEESEIRDFMKQYLQ
jgi:hypothetical protein